MKLDFNTLGIDIGSTTVKIAILNKDGEIIFSDYQRHYANIQETLAKIIDEAYEEFGDIPVSPMITGSGGLTLSKHMEIPFVQEVVAVATSLKDYAPRTDVAIELGGEDAKIIYFTGGIDQRMNGICAGGTGSFIDQMATLLKTDAAGLNEYAKNYKAIYPIAARCGVFAKTGGYLVDGRPRKLHPRECARLMGYPDSYIISDKSSHAYQQFGNSVVVDVIQYIGIEIGKAII